MSREPSPIKILSENRKARFNYHILDTLEAGILLTGAEVKSIRQGGISISESYVRPEGEEIYLIGAHIKPYPFDKNREHDPTRKRKLLLHKHEINKLRGSVDKKGLTIVPLKLYLKRGYVKLEIALAKGKDAPDKRRTVKDREGKREAAQAMKQRGRGD